AGLDAAYNPLWALLDARRIGLAGHSYGAAGVSYVGQWDPRVSAIVAWDNLNVPDPTPAPLPGAAITSNGANFPGEKDCPSDPAARATVPITKPGLGMSGDYFIQPQPDTTLPDPLAKSTASIAYTHAGVDSGEIVLRGATH